jgi:hypothetical protein
MRNLLLGIATAVLVFAGLAAAGFAASPLLVPEPPNTYRTAVYDITIPKDWSCIQEVTETVCTPNGPPPHRAIMIAAMKIRNPEMDSPELYAKHLNKPMVDVAPDGKPMTSTPEHIGQTVIEGRTWVDATHLDSQIRGYRTRYLGAFTTQIAILITFSSYKDDFEKYQPVFERMVRSLNIYQRYDGRAEAPPG